MRSDRSRITYGDEPTIYGVAGLHDSDTAYRDRTRKTDAVTQSQRDMLERCDVNAVYRASVEACIRDLGLNAETAARLFGHVAPELV